MNKEFCEKCEEIFGHKNTQEIDKEKLQEYENLTGIKLSQEHLYLIENYEDVILEDGFGFVAKELSPFADSDGYETFIEFLGFNSEYYTLISTYEMLEEQLPDNVYPIAEMDGGNYICISKKGDLYIWLHDHLEQDGLFLANTSIEELVLSIEQMPEHEVDLDDVELELSDELWDSLLNGDFN